jgi:hypothetical protein
MSHSFCGAKAVGDQPLLVTVRATPVIVNGIRRVPTISPLTFMGPRCQAPRFAVPMTLPLGSATVIWSPGFGVSSEQSA